MANANHPARRAGLPAAESILQTAVLTPRRPAATAEAAIARPARTYTILRTKEVDAYDAPLAEAEFATAGAQRFAGVGDNFAGKARKAAKLSVGTGTIEPFDDVQKLIQSLPSDDDMIDHDPPITTGQSSGRVAEEQRNVSIRGFLYAASREADNDFHLIVGRDPNASPSMYMTMEISGLPPSSSPSFPQLSAARNAYKSFFGDKLPGASYDFYDPPIEVKIQGSLFFDMSHAHGQHPGPPSLEPDMPVIWEVQTAIEFEPGP
jgi:hypothetical protein